MVSRNASFFSFFIPLTCLSLLLFSEQLTPPPSQIPPELVSAFTWNGEIPVSLWYSDETHTLDKPSTWEAAYVDELIEKAAKHETSSFEPYEKYLFEALEYFSKDIEGKKIAIFGPGPLYEALVISFGGTPISIEYQPIVTNHPKIRVMTPLQWEASKEKFDAIIAMATVGREGLGRRGDPIDPDGDLHWMQKAKNEMLNPHGLLLLAVVVGQDRLFWNVHRQYGSKRLERLLEGWDCLRTFGFSPYDLAVEEYRGHLPLFVLTPSENP
jgi:hypothetical protein